MQTLLRALPVPEGVLQSTQRKFLTAMVAQEHKRQQVGPTVFAL